MAVKTLQFNIVFDDEWADPLEAADYWSTALRNGHEQMPYDSPRRDPEDESPYQNQDWFLLDGDHMTDIPPRFNIRNL